MNRFNFSANSINYKLTIAIGFFLIVLAMIILILRPNFQDFKAIEREIKEKRIELATKEEYLSKLNEIKAELEEYREGLSKINSALPSNPSLPSLFNFFQETSSESGLILEKINSFTTSPYSDFSAIQETNFSIGVVGHYSSFKNFLLALEKSARLVKIENISFSLTEREDLFSFNLKMKVYSY